ncbi:hypothetical protein OIDMADRAFT_31540 [Oidiodendron maius Zn]|uniref:Cyanovirin-N domain-containing protein n=1 Tax=Oidiodendron maius (strain Zn) TaxID=913774 RepID=A0A0C3H8R7_OIDMZ|nr:hypothetical protein OIDMADRAFT_31540 [Oidiodendron maius Zn]
MQYINLLNLAFLALSYFTLDVVADSGYAASCNSIQIYDSDNVRHWVIFANCREESGIYNVGNAINIGSCFANSGGGLVGRLNGGFDGSCSNIGLSGTILSATCGNGAGGYDSTSIDTNNWIGNYNGVMTCFGQNGL